MFTERIPAEVKQAAADTESDADIYIADYNIYMGHLLTPKGKTIFPSDMRLLCHWNLRDEIKANYNKGKEGLEKQRMVYEVMKRSTRIVTNGTRTPIRYPKLEMN